MGAWHLRKAGAFPSLSLGFLHKLHSLLVLRYRVYFVYII